MIIRRIPFGLVLERLLKVSIRSISIDIGKRKNIIGVAVEIGTKP